MPADHIRRAYTSGIGGRTRPGDQSVIDEATAAERKRAMREAVTYGLPCDIWVNSRGVPVQAKSRFFGMQAADDVPHVVVEAPVLDGTIVPLRPGEDVDVFFMVDNVRYTYRARVISRGRFPLNGGGVARSLEISYPRRLTRGQKREFFRTTISLIRPIELQLGLMDPKSADPISNPAVLFRRRSVIVNLSGGGLAFDLPQQHRLLLRPGQRLLCHFSLPSTQTLELQGRVTHRLPVSAERATRFGMRFIDVHRAVRFRTAHDRVLRYVARVQREMLAKRSGLRE